MTFVKCAAAALVAAIFNISTAGAAPCAIGTCEINGGLASDSYVGIEDENVAPGAYFAAGSFTVSGLESLAGVIDVSFDGGSGSVPAGFADLTISFEQDGAALGSFAITDAAGFQILDAFHVAIASASDVFFEIAAVAFECCGVLPDYNIIVSEAPVPAAFPLLASGLAGLYFAARSRRRDL